jgi:hypothetical protein
VCGVGCQPRLRFNSGTHSGRGGARGTKGHTLPKGKTLERAAYTMSLNLINNPLCVVGACCVRVFGPKRTVRSSRESPCGGVDACTTHLRRDVSSGPPTLPCLKNNIPMFNPSCTLNSRKGKMPDLGLPRGQGHTKGARAPSQGNATEGMQGSHSCGLGGGWWAKLGGRSNSERVERPAVCERSTGIGSLGSRACERGEQPRLGRGLASWRVGVRSRRPQLGKRCRCRVVCVPGKLPNILLPPKRKTSGGIFVSTGIIT